MKTQIGIDELNDMIVSGEIDEFIRICEARQCKALSKIADDITGRDGVRVVLAAGASSAGKTTTAKRLCTQLGVNGFKAMHCSTDDYFVGDRRNPRDENGELDYETVDAVDVARLAEDVNALLAGREVKLRKFDFSRHDGYDAKNPTRIDRDTILVIEGIHALNPRLTADIDEATKYRLFIEPKPEIAIFAFTCMDGADARMLRRLVRDNQFRRLDPIDTFRIWPKVIAGEAKWIEPFRHLAGATFNSSLTYELGVLKPYVEGLLQRVMRRQPENDLAAHLAEILQLVLPIPPVSVPGDSILRETIGSSQLEY